MNLWSMVTKLIKNFGITSVLQKRALLPSQETMLYVHYYRLTSTAACQSLNAKIGIVS